MLIAGGEDPAVVGLADLAHARRGAHDLHERLPGICLGEELGELGAGDAARGAHVAAGHLALVQGHKVRLELDGAVASEQCELLLDLRRVPVAGDLVGENVLPGHREVGALVKGPAGAGDALLGVDDHVGDQSGPRERRESEQRGRRVAAWVRDDIRAGDRVAVQLGQSVHRLREQPGSRVWAIPALICLQRAEPEVRAEVDNARAGLPQRRHCRRGRRMRVGDDGRVNAAERGRVQRLDDQRDAVARIQVLERAPHLRAARYADKVKAGVLPEQLGGQRAREARRAGDHDARRARRRRLRAQASHEARLPSRRGPRRSARARVPRPRR